MQEISVGVIGDPEVGKTILSVSYTSNYVYHKYTPTILHSYWTNMMMDDTPVSLTLWDTSGQVAYNKLRPLVYSYCDAFLVCFSLVSRRSFNDIMKWHHEIQRHAPGKPFILVGCKKDLRTDRIGGSVNRHELEKTANEIGAESFVETSAVIQEGLNECFESVIRAALSWQKHKSR